MYVLERRLHESVYLCRASLFAYLFTGDVEERWRVANQWGVRSALRRLERQAGGDHPRHCCFCLGRSDWRRRMLLWY